MAEPTKDQHHQDAADVFKKISPLEKNVPRDHQEEISVFWEHLDDELTTVQRLGKSVSAAGKNWRSTIPDYEKVHEVLQNIHVSELDVAQRLYRVLGYENFWDKFLEKGIDLTPKNALFFLEKITGFTVDIHPTQLQYVRDVVEIAERLEYARKAIKKNVKEKSKEALLSEVILESRFQKGTIIPPSALIDAVLDDDVFTQDYVNTLLLDMVAATVLEREGVERKPILDVYGEREKPKKIFPWKNIQRTIQVIVLGTTLASQVPSVSPVAIAYAATSPELHKAAFSTLKSGYGALVQEEYWRYLSKAYQSELEKKYGICISYSELGRLPENTHYRSIDFILQQAFQDYAKKTGKTPHWRVAPGYRDTQYYRESILREVDQIEGVVGRTIRKDNEFVKTFFPEDARGAVDSSLGNIGSIFDFPLASVPNDLTDRVERFHKEHPKQDDKIAIQIYFAEIASFTESRSRVIGGPVSTSEILTFILEKNDGDISKSLWGLVLFLKYASRNHNPEGEFSADNPTIPESDWIARYVLDEFTFGDISYNDLQQAYTQNSLLQRLSNCRMNGAEYCNKDWDLNNRIGGPYHVFNLIALLSIMPPELVSDAWMAKFAKDRLWEQGIVKLRTGYVVVSNLQHAQRVLDVHTLRYENPLSQNDIVVTSYPVVNMSMEEGLVVGMSTLFPQIPFDSIQQQFKGKLLAGEPIDLSEISHTNGKNIGHTYVYLRNITFGDPGKNGIVEFVVVQQHESAPISPNILKNISETGTGKYVRGNHTIDFSVNGALQDSIGDLLYQRSLVPQTLEAKLKVEILRNNTETPLFSSGGLHLVEADVPKDKLHSYLDEHYPGWIQAGNSLDVLNIKEKKPQQLIYQNNIAITTSGSILLFVPTEGGSVNFSGSQRAHVGIIEARSISDLRTIEGLFSAFSESLSFLRPAALNFKNPQEQLKFVFDKVLQQEDHFWQVPHEFISRNDDEIIIPTDWLVSHGFQGDWGTADTVRLRKGDKKEIFIEMTTDFMNSVEFLKKDGHPEVSVWSNMPDKIWEAGTIFLDEQGNVFITNTSSLSLANTIPGKTETRIEKSKNPSNTFAAYVSPNNRFPLPLIDKEISEHELARISKDGFLIHSDSNGNMFMTLVYRRQNSSFDHALGGSVLVTQPHWSHTSELHTDGTSLLSEENEYLVVKVPIEGIYKKFVTTTDKDHIGEMMNIFESHFYPTVFPSDRARGVVGHPQVLGVITKENLRKNFIRLVEPGSEKGGPRFATWTENGWERPEKIIEHFLAGNEKELEIATMNGIYRIQRTTDGYFYITRDELESFGKKFGGDLFADLDISIEEYAKYRSESLDVYFQSNHSKTEQIRPVSVYAQQVQSVEDVNMLLSKISFSSDKMTIQIAEEYDALISHAEKTETYVPLLYSMRRILGKGYLYMKKGTDGSVVAYVLFPKSEWDGKESEMIQHTLKEVGVFDGQGKGVNPLFLPRVDLFDKRGDEDVFVLNSKDSEVQHIFVEMGLHIDPEKQKLLVTSGIPITLDNGTVVYRAQVNGTNTYFYITDKDILKVIDVFGLTNDILDQTTRSFLGEGSEGKTILKKENIRVDELRDLLTRIHLEFQVEQLEKSNKGRSFITMAKDKNGISRFYVVAIYADKNDTYNAYLYEYGDDLSYLGSELFKGEAMVVRGLDLSTLEK